MLSFPALTFLFVSGCSEEEIPHEPEYGARIAVAGPITTGSSAGLPVAYDLAAYGYVEEEYFLEGIATCCRVTHQETAT